MYNQGKADHTQIIAQLTKRDGSFLVGRSDGEFSWEDLRGKTVIGGRKGGVPEMTLEYVLRRNGLTPGVDVTVDTSVQFNMMAGAFTGGQGDYVTLFEPAATQVVTSGEGYILCSIGAESGAIPYTAYFASQSYTAEHDDMIAAFCRAIAKALDWVDSHTDREVAEAIIGQFPDTSLDTLEAVTARHREIGAWNTPLTMEKAALERLVKAKVITGQTLRKYFSGLTPLIASSRPWTTNIIPSAMYEATTKPPSLMMSCKFDPATTLVIRASTP